jgi:hypothetical protein
MRPSIQTTTLFAAVLLTIAAQNDPIREQLSNEVSIAEKLRIVRDRVTALQSTPAAGQPALAQRACISGYWRNC